MTASPALFPLRRPHFSLPATLAYTAVTVALLAMLGWFVPAPGLASFLPNQIPLPISTAYALLLFGVALGLLARPSGHRWGLLAGSLALSIGPFSLLEPMLGLSFDPHQWFALPFGTAIRLPGVSTHPTIHAAIAITLCGIALVLIGHRGGWRTSLSQVCAALALLDALTIVTAYIHGTEKIYGGLPGFTASPPATLAVILLALGILALRKDYGFMAIISSREPGGLMLRRLLPFAVLMPMFVSWFSHRGVETGWYDPRLEGAVLSLTTTLISVAALILIGAVLNRKSLALRESQEAADALINATPESAILMDVDGTVRGINEIGAQRLNQTPDAMIGHNIYDLFPASVAEQRRRMLTEVIHTRLPLRASDTRNGYHFEHHIYPIPSPDGEIERVAIYAKDVTEQKQAQAVETLLHGIDQQILRGTELDELLQFTCDEIAGLFGFPFVWVGRKETDGRLDVVAWAGTSSGYHQHIDRIGVRWDESPEGRGPAGNTVRSGQPQLCHLDDPMFQPWQDAAKEFGLSAVLGLPLRLHGEVYGALTLYGQAPDCFDARSTFDRMYGIALRLNIALEMAVEHEQIRLLSVALATASNGIFIASPGGNIQWLNAAFARLSGYAEAELLGQTPRVLNSGMHAKDYYQTLWQTILSGQTWSSETIDRHKSGALYTVQQTVTPILDSAGKVSHFIAIMEDITAQKASEDLIRHMAHYDALTDLPNRALFYDRLNQALALARRKGHQAALLFLDLDKFKSINDSLGHSIGDLLLQGVAERLRASVRESDTVARLAGDEFTVILPQIRTESEACAVAKKIIERLGQSFLLNGHEVNTAASIGIALAPRDSDDDDELLKLADDAMYQAKAGGRGRYCIYRPVIQSED